MADLPIVLGPAGIVPTPPATLLQQLLALVASINPQATLNLPGTLTEDIASTDVGALILLNQGLVELINSITPLGANAFVLSQIGQQIGIPIGLNSNTSVYITFTGDPGFVIGQGFLVSDGTFQYALLNGGIIGSDGQSIALFALATQTGTWSVPSGTVTQPVTSIPSDFPLTFVNQTPGTPGTGAETETSYRARVLQGQLAASQGMLSYLKTLLGAVANVQPRLISAIPQSGGGWEIICGGGDPYQVAYAIYQAVPDISTLVGSTLGIVGITNANPGVVTTDLNHLFAPGQVIEIASSDPTNYNGTYALLSTPLPTTFALGTAFPAVNFTALSWVSTAGGEINGTTASAHGITVGSTFVISGAIPTGYNGTYVAISGTSGSTIVAAQTTTLATPATTAGQILAGVANFNTSAISPYIANGVVTPNLRNVAVTITDYPDTYVIPFVNPPPQTVAMTVTWNTSSVNFVSPTAIAQAAAPAIAAYINSIPVGKPINELQMTAAFQASIADILAPYLLTRLVFTVAINGIGVSPVSGTETIFGDASGYFIAFSSGISVVQG
jgi:Baseplate J-like protein